MEKRVLKKDSIAWWRGLLEALVRNNSRQPSKFEISSGWRVEYDGCLFDASGRFPPEFGLTITFGLVETYPCLIGLIWCFGWTKECWAKGWWFTRRGIWSGPLLSVGLVTRDIILGLNWKTKIDRKFLRLSEIRYEISEVSLQARDIFFYKIDRPKIDFIKIMSK